MGPVERAVRRHTAAGMRLLTPTGRGSFVVERIDGDGIVLLLGAQEAWTRLSWACLEGAGRFLSDRSWVRIGSVYSTAADPHTLDGYLKHHVKRATAGWVAALLERAEVVEIDRTRPATVRLAPTFHI